MSRDDFNITFTEAEKTGLLLDPENIKLHRLYFSQMCQLLGIKVLYRAPIDSSKQYNGYGELDSHYLPAISVNCIWDEHPSEKTMKKLGWNTELADTTAVIHVPYDLQGLQAGCLFIIPSGLDNTTGRVFKVLRMTNIAIYPASISCELGPMLKNTDEKSTIQDFKHTNFNLLEGEENDI